jgi:acetolactate synthase-1/2/3 large subunit
MGSAQVVMTKASQRIGADAIVDSFVRQELKRLFVFPGGTIAPILDIAIQRGLEIVCTRHEQGAGYAALGAARLTGRPHVVMVTSGPGVTNVVTPVADAYFDSVPLVVLTGQVGTGDMRGERPVRQRGFQEVDTVALMRPISKAQFLATSPSQLPEIMQRAFQVAMEGRRGPVVVDLPMNTQRGELPPTALAPASPKGAAELDMSAIDQIASWISAAKRPVILAGQGILLSGAHSELRRLAENARIPVSQSLLGLGSFPTESVLALGFHGHTGNQYAGKAIHGADLLLVLGSRLDIRQTGTQVNDFVPTGRVVRIDIDITEIENSRVRSDLTIHGDVHEVLRQLNERMDGLPQPDSAEWLEQIHAWRTQFPLTYDERGPLKPQYVIQVADCLTRGQSVICVSGVGSHQQWVARHFNFDYPSRPWLTSGGHGAMGFDLPVAIGAQVTFPGRPVICFVGDGSLQMNIQELAAVVEYSLPIKIVVLNNHRLGIVSQFQLLNWKSDPTCGHKWNPDFAAVARAYGIPATTVTTADEVRPAVEQALTHPGPFLLDCIVDEAEDVVPMLLAGQKMDAMWPYA